MTDLDALDAEIQQLEEELKKDDGSGSKYGSPSPKKKDDFFSFFKEILQSDDSRKVSDLDKEDLRKVRGLLDISLYAEAEGLDKVSQYLVDKGENLLSTAMSRKGFFAKLLVTQIKKEQKIGEGNKEPKKGLFSFGNKPEVAQSEE